MNEQINEWMQRLNKCPGPKKNQPQRWKRNPNKYKHSIFLCFKHIQLDCFPICYSYYVSTFTCEILSPSDAHSFSIWRNWSPAKWNDLNKTMTSYIYNLNLDPNFYQRSNLLIGCFGGFNSFCSFPLQIKQQNTSYEKSIFVSMRQKTIVQSQRYFWQVNNHYSGDYIQGIIKEATFAISPC